MATGDPVVSEVRATATAEQLLERYGIVTHDTVLSEGVPGGFAGLYPVLTAMEDVGRVRRGYFVEGRGGSQFALPGAVDRLRATSDTGVVVLAATDPANLYGATLPWPEVAEGRAARRAGAHVVLLDGALIGFIERGGRTVLTFEPSTAGDPASADAAIEAVATALAELADRNQKRLTIETVNGDAVGGSVLAGPLKNAGFAVGYKGLTRQPSRTAGRRA